ncbi:AsmA-like C-terminal region-containing protein [Rhizobium helianthi]|uniref:AsmA-like C-terminal region-containing protein n=1 Tax=Rhizobium helianthi TaxID=1132695 RepID=A0ABW4LXI2_9HYPH
MLGRIFLVIGGFVVVALFAALLAPVFVDWTNFRVGFEQQASRILGKKVTVHGPVEARILPFPSVTMRDVRVGQDTDGSPLVQVAQFSMDMELAPFLSGEARVFDMRIEKPKARIRLLKDGRLDWMRGSRPDIPARNVVLEDVHITDAQIEFIDEASGRNRLLTNLTADLSAHSLAGPWRAEGNATLDGYEAQFTLNSGEPDSQSGQVPLKLRLRPDIQPVEVQLDGALGVRGARPEYKGEFSLSFLDQPAAGTTKQAAPRTKGKFELTNDCIRIPEYRIEAGAIDNPYVVTGEATLDTGEKPEFLLTADGQQVDVDKLAAELVPRGKTSRDAHFSAQRRVNALIAMAARIPVPRVPGRATVHLPAIVTEGTTIRDIRLDLRPKDGGWTVENAVAILPGRTQVEASGQLVLTGEPSFTGKMLLASNQPSGFSDWLTGNVDPAIRRLKAAGFSADVALTRQSQRFEQLELAVGGATLKGRLERSSATDAKPVPDLALDLAGDEIDLDAIRALASLLTGQDAGQQALDHHLTAHLKADRLTAFGVAAHGVEAELELGDSGLSIEKLAVADLAGAQLSARGSAEGSLLNYRGKGTITLSAEEAAPFLTMLREQLPRHPVLERLARNPAAFSNTNLTAELTLGDAANLAISGVSNGTRIETSIQAQNLLDLTQETEYQLIAKLTNPLSVRLLDQLGVETLPFDGDANAALDVTAKGNGKAEADISLNYRTDATVASASGKVSLAADKFGDGLLNIALKSSDIEPSLLVAGISMPQFGSGLPIDARVQISLDPNVVKFDRIEGAIAGNAVSGELAYDRTIDAPTWTGKLDLGALDEEWLAEAVYGPLYDPQTGAFSEQPFSQPAFGRADVTLDLSAKSVPLWPGVAPLSGFSARLSNRSNGISLEEVKAEWLGGSLNGRLAMSSSEGIGLLQTRLSLQDADLAPLMWERAGHSVASGKIGFELATEATAKTPAALLVAANGSGTLHLQDVVLPGLAESPLKDLLAQADRIDGDVTEAKVRPLVQNRIFAGKMQVGAVELPFTMSAGQVRFQNIAAQAGATRLSGDARFSLSEQTVDASLLMAYDAGEDAVAGGDAEVALRFRGDWSEPEQQLELGAITNFLSLRAFEQERRRVETLQASVLEKQRLRREVSLYQSLDNERRLAKEKAEAEARRVEEEAARQRAEEQRREQQKPEVSTPGLSVPPTVEHFRMEELPGVTGN